jgi:hypothetical protein
MTVNHPEPGHLASGDVLFRGNDENWVVYFLIERIPRKGSPTWRILCTQKQKLFGSDKVFHHETTLRENEILRWYVKRTYNEKVSWTSDDGTRKM